MFRRKKEKKPVSGKTLGAHGVAREVPFVPVMDADITARAYGAAREVPFVPVIDADITARAYGATHEVPFVPVTHAGITPGAHGAACEAPFAHMIDADITPGADAVKTLVPSVPLGSVAADVPDILKGIILKYWGYMGTGSMSFTEYVRYSRYRFKSEQYPGTSVAMKPLLLGDILGHSQRAQIIEAMSIFLELDDSLYLSSSLLLDEVFLVPSKSRVTEVDNVLLDHAILPLLSLTKMILLVEQRTGKKYILALLDHHDRERHGSGDLLGDLEERKNTIYLNGIFRRIDTIKDDITRSLKTRELREVRKICMQKVACQHGSAAKEDEDYRQQVSAELDKMTCSRPSLSR